jgi:hypothetical protein
MHLALAAAAISPIGSTTPCGNAGTEPTTITVSGVMAAAIACGSAVKSARNGVRIGVRPMKCAALSKAGCALVAITIWGVPIAGRRCRAWSRAAFTARKMLSVPPVVMAPRANAPPCSRPRPIATTSDSKRSRLPKARRPRPFSEKYIR